MPVQRSRDRDVRAALRAFDEQARANEWEHAWDALAEVARLAAPGPSCWRFLEEAAALMALESRRAEAALRVRTCVTPPAPESHPGGARGG